MKQTCLGSLPQHARHRDGSKVVGPARADPQLDIAIGFGGAHALGWGNPIRTLGLVHGSDLTGIELVIACFL